MKILQDDTLRNPKFSEWFLSQYRKQQLQGTSGTHMLDEVGNYHGQQHERYVYSFDGVSGYVSVPNSAYSNPITSYELEITVRMNNYNDNYVALIGARNNANFGFTLTQQLGRLVFFQNGVFLGSGINPLDNWVNIKVTWDGNTIDFYVDDVLTVSDTTSATLNINKGINIGSRSENYDHGFLQLDGEVSYVRLLLNNEETIYKFEEQQGVVAYDASGSGNHGTLMNGVTHSIARDPFLTNYTNEYGYTNDNGTIIPRIVNSDLDALGNNCEFKGKVAADAKLINSNCINSDGISVEGTFNFDTTGLTVTSKEGTATVTFDNANDKIIVGSGTLYNLVLSNGYHFPLAEGLGTRSYRALDHEKYITWSNITWTTQDEYHYNITQGFTEDKGVKLPLKGLVKVEDYPWTWIIGNGGAGFYGDWKGNWFLPSNNGTIEVGDAIDYAAVAEIDLNSQSLTTDFTNVLFNKFTQLKRLILYNNSISEINTTSLNLIEDVIVYDNLQLTSLNLINNSELKRANVYRCNLDSIILPNTSPCYELSLFSNNLTSIDLKSNNSITQLNLADNNLTSIDLKSNQLIDFRIDRNQLTQIDLTGQSELSVLYAYNNFTISTISGFNDCTSLTNVRLYNNLLTDLSVANKPLITFLQIQNNRLSNLVNSQILIDLDNHGKPNGYFQSSIFGGGEITAAAKIAVDNLRAKDWEVLGLGV